MLWVAKRAVLRHGWVVLALVLEGIPIACRLEKNPLVGLEEKRRWAPPEQHRDPANAMPARSPSEPSLRTCLTCTDCPEKHKISDHDAMQWQTAF
jgi:hypothetical protein